MIKTQEPNIRAISLTVTEHDPKAIAPGYWFVAPLVNSKVPLPEDREYAPLKTGAQIYNRNGVRHDDPYVHCPTC